MVVGNSHHIIKNIRKLVIIINVSVDFEMFQGTTKYLECTIYDEDGNTPLDITSSSEIKLGVKRYGELNSSPIITKLLSTGGISIDGINKAIVKISPTDTTTLIGKMQYELRITDPTGDIFVPISGLFIINPKST